MNVLVIATLQAVISNKIMKAICTRFMGNKKIIKKVLSGFAVIIFVNIIITVMFYLF